jgi:hypothetical protein
VENGFFAGKLTLNHYIVTHIVGLGLEGIGNYNTIYADEEGSKISLWESRPQH